jgi:oligopeptidase B
MLCNQHPEMLAGAILKVPYLDMMTSLLDHTLPLTVHEHDEWGDPVANDATLEYLLQICPIRNAAASLRNQTADSTSADILHPHVLATAAMLDERVQFWHPAKYIAALRAAGHANAFLLTTDDTGHFGRTAEAEALEIAFCLRSVGQPLR